jgi:hypothetical protein
MVREIGVHSGALIVCHSNEFINGPACIVERGINSGCQTATQQSGTPPSRGSAAKLQ